MNAALAMPSRRFRALIIGHVLRWPRGRHVQIGRGVRLQNLRGVRFGSRVVIHRHTHLDLRGGLTIGSDVVLASDVTVLTADHDPDSPDRAYRARGVDIGDRTWIATGAVVLPGTIVGEGVIVAAGAVVRGTLAPWGIYAGNPARRVRDRDTGAQRELDGGLAPLQ